MYPAICDQDLIEVAYFYSPKRAEEIAPGQVVLTRAGSEWVIHRMTNAKRKALTKGDWSGFYDQSLWIWGEVKKINQKPSRLVRDPILATASRFVDRDNNVILRRCVRLFIYIYVTWIKWIERKD